MATPGQLVRTMASVLGIPEPTITQYDRNLAEAGLRQIRGRGTSAAEVSAEDAANLLVAILGRRPWAPRSELPPIFKDVRFTCG